ncbi:MAG TPA: CoA transferase [Rhizomicrobium sp.]|jgi:crotonobetainyl-CoA:carnitine CoA-transferase CaiB-like acyl-CoA transferase|nr:CoA transferase [Rhizomicrobium sp.]
MSPRAAFEYLNRIAGLAPLGAPLFEGADPILPSPFRAAEAAAASLGLSAAVAAEIWRLRGGDRQKIAIDLKAAAGSLLSFAFVRRDGAPVPRPALDAPAVGLYRTVDGRWIHLHGGFPDQWPRMLGLLNAGGDRESVARAVAKWNAFALENAIAYLGLSGAVVRSPEEWDASVQGRALAQVPPVVLRKIGEAPPLRLGDSGNPLEGIRVLDLTRVLAGPVCGRTLASHGADVLHVRAGKLETIELFELDTGHGKRAADLDLAAPADAERLRRLVRDAHVFVDSYRPGALAKHGFTPAALAHVARGMTYVSVSCYGHDGPWATRRGWEQLAQSATGLAHVQGAFRSRPGEKGEAAPALVPAAVCDYVTGYLAAAGAAAAILRRMREGGSWHVQVSLCATAVWLRSLGMTGAAPESWDPGEGLDRYLQSCETVAGRLGYLGPVVEMSKTPPAWRFPPPYPGADAPRWLDMPGEPHAAEAKSA